MSELNIRESDVSIIFTAKVVPGSSPPDKISGVLDGMLKIKVTSAPEKGKANQGLIKFLARVLGVKKNSIRIISGQTSQIKQVQVSGIPKDTFLKKISNK
jgi:uncharacterized protein (TIGR00251 family)